MPTFTFTSPDGKDYSVDGPEGATPDQAYQILQQHLGASTPSDSGGSSLTGMAKAAGVGLLQGTIGTGADIVSGVDHLISGDKATTPNVFGSESLGNIYKPQGPAEEVANLGGQFLPGVIGGGEGIASKLATRVAAPALATEAAGKLTEGTAAQPYAELGAALLGSAGATAAANKFRAMAAARGAADASISDIKAGARAVYQHPDVTDVQFKPGTLGDLADTINTDLQHGTNSGFRPANEPKVFNAVDELNNASNAGRPATIADIDNVRQVLGNAAKERDAQGQLTRQAVAANRAMDHIDNFLPNLQQSDLLAGDANAANAQLQSARKDWQSYRQAQNVQTLRDNAEINAAAAHSGANIGNYTRQAFKPMMKNNFQKAGGYTDAEKAALSQIVRGTWPGAITRAAGNVLGGGGGLGMLAGGAAGYEEGGIPGALAAGAAGMALKKISNRSTLNSVAKLDKLIRSKSPTAIKMAAQNPQVAHFLPPASSRLLTAMIAADPLLSQQLQPAQ